VPTATGTTELPYRPFTYKEMFPRIDWRKRNECSLSFFLSFFLALMKTVSLKRGSFNLCFSKSEIGKQVLKNAFSLSIQLMEST
jgi:hypothetical protein